MKSLLPWVAVAVLGFALGALWRERAHEGWEQDRKDVLARADSVQSVADAFAQAAARYHQRADSLGRAAARLDSIARQRYQEVARERQVLIAYRDSVRTAGDTMVPVSRLDDALAVVEDQQLVIAAQREVIRTLSADTATLAAASRLNAQAAATWKGAAEERERVLADFRAKPKPKLLGILPAPSPTVTFIAGAVVALVAREQLTPDE